MQKKIIIVSLNLNVIMYPISVVNIVENKVLPFKNEKSTKYIYENKIICNKYN